MFFVFSSPHFEQIILTGLSFRLYAIVGLVFISYPRLPNEAYYSSLFESPISIPA